MSDAGLGGLSDENPGCEPFTVDSDNMNVMMLFLARSLNSGHGENK